MTTRRTDFRCRRCAAIAIATLIAGPFGCSDRETPSDGAREPLTRPSPREPVPLAPSVEARYYTARLAETLRGLSHARGGYRDVLEASDVDPVLAARAALELAEHAAAERRRRVALELIARASALGAGNAEITARASRLHSRLASVSARDIEVRGPPAGTELEGVSATASALFAEAEELLATYLRRRPSPRLENVMSSVRGKRGALEAAERVYKQVVALDEYAATAAAEFRIASMYYDLSLSLTADLTREMEPAAAQKFKVSLRSMATTNRRRARSAYRRALEAAFADESGSAARWRQAAALGLTSVEDLLRGR